MIGMRRPTKTKVEMVETALQEGDEVEDDTGSTGEQLTTTKETITAATHTHVLSAAAQSKLDAATDAFLEAEMHAEALREIATGREAKEKLAQRVHDAKMRRLDKR
jgi:hypothetical protein